jgi:hypothetical protein
MPQRKKETRRLIDELPENATWSDFVLFGSLLSGSDPL